MLHSTNGGCSCTPARPAWCAAISKGRHECWVEPEPERQWWRCIARITLPQRSLPNPPTESCSRLSPGPGDQHSRQPQEPVRNRVRSDRSHPSAQLGRELFESQSIHISIASRAELDVCWQNAFSAVGTGEWPEGFFRSEWERVVQAQGITTKEEYLQAPRTGQSVRLARPQRAQVWEVLDEFKRGLAASGKLEWTDLIRQTRLYLANSGVALPYRAVVVDETQDWHPEDLKLIRQIVPSGANDLFLVGDAHQRIYGRPVVLGQCGINVRGGRANSVSTIARRKRSATGRWAF